MLSTICYGVWIKMKFRKTASFLKTFAIEKLVIHYNIKFYVPMRLTNLKKYTCKVKSHRLLFQTISHRHLWNGMYFSTQKSKITMETI